MSLDPLPYADNPGPRHAPTVALQQGEVHFRRLLEKLPAGAYTCDADGLITYYNQRAVELWGRAPRLNDPADRYCGSFKLLALDGTPLAHEQCWMALALREDRAYDGAEILIERPDGTRVTAMAHANPIHDDRGCVLGAVNVLVDISDRKRAEDSLREADHSKNEFLATLAHELRNPLAPIRNAVQLLQLGDGSAVDGRWALEVIDRQTRHLARLIDDLLDIARITRDRLPLHKQRIELARVLDDALETVRPLFDRSGHRLDVRVAREPIWVDADATRLGQVVANLLNNAAKFTASGGRIRLEARRDGSEAVIDVADSGIGIPADCLAGIFEMFSQAERPGDRVRGGLGVGLALTKRLVELHGGTVTAASPGRDQGSRFTVRLPAAAGPGDASRRTRSRAKRPPVRASLRILIAEDHPDAAESLGRLLESMGNEVRTTGDGPAALAAAGEFRPEVALLDIGLPGIGGCELARRLRAEPWGATVTLIAVTGWGQRADRQRSREAGFDLHLVKPVDPDRLMRLIASLDERRRTRGRA